MTARRLALVAAYTVLAMAPLLAGGVFGYDLGHKRVPADAVPRLTAADMVFGGRGYDLNPAHADHRVHSWSKAGHADVYVTDGQIEFVDPASGTHCTVPALSQDFGTIDEGLEAGDGAIAQVAANPSLLQVDLRQWGTPGAQVLVVVGDPSSGDELYAYCLPPGTA